MRSMGPRGWSTHCQHRFLRQGVAMTRVRLAFRPNVRAVADARSQIDEVGGHLVVFRPEKKWCGLQTSPKRIGSPSIAGRNDRILARRLTTAFGAKACDRNLPVADIGRSRDPLRYAPIGGKGLDRNRFLIEC